MSENPAGGAALPSSPSLESVVGEMYGDYRSAEPAPAEPGAPPAAGGETPAGSEGAPTDPETPPGDETPDGADGQPVVPDPEHPASTSDPDPLEGATPLPYTVNGQARTFDGVTVLKDGGAIVDPEALPKLAQRLAERDHLYEQNQQRHTDYQALEKLTEWPTRGQNGETIVLRGREAVEAQRVALASLVAEKRAYDALFADPNNLRDLLVGNEDGSLAWNPVGLRAFQAELKNAQMDLAGKARAAVAQMARPAAPAPFQPATLAPTAVSRVVEMVGAKGWTEADRQWAEALAPRFIRLTTAEDVAANPQLVAGNPMVEQQFIDLIKERVAARATTATTVSTATKVAKDNAAKLAAAKAGQKPGQKPATITPQPPPERTRDDDFDDAFTRAEKAAAGALRAHMAGVVLSGSVLIAP